MSDAHGVARDQLRSFIERIERLEEEKKTIADDIKDVYGEAKGTGFEPKILKEVIKIRKMDRDERMEREAILDTYLAALGMIEQPHFFAGEPVASTPTRSPAMALQSPRKAAEAVSERTAINQPETADEMQHPGSHLIGNPEPALAAANRPTGDDGTVRMARTEAAAVTDRRDDHLISEPDGGAISEVKGKARLENADGVEPPPSVTIPKPAPSMDELRIANALILRPNCKRPGQETCGGQGRTHCRDCIAAPVEKVREEA